MGPKKTSESKFKRKKGFSTESVHGHDFYDVEKGLFKVPIYMTAIYEQFDKVTGKERKTERNVDLKYSREDNLTVNAFEKALCKLEQGEDALAFNSGMAAISTIYLHSLSYDDRILITKESYGLTQQLARDMGKYGIKTVLAGPETDDLVDSINKRFKMVVIETITNPLLKVVDIDKIAKRCLEVGAKLVVDNTFATPLLLKPLKHGAWVSMNSLTKYIGGHNDLIGGSIASDSKSILQLFDWRKKIGNIMNPFEAFLMLRSLPTLKIRFMQESKTAKELAEYLLNHNGIQEVFYPGLKSSPYINTANRLFEEKVYGGVLCLKIKGGRDEVGGARGRRVQRRRRAADAVPRAAGGLRGLLPAPRPGPPAVLRAPHPRPRDGGRAHRRDVRGGVRVTEPVPRPGLGRRCVALRHRPAPARSVPPGRRRGVQGASAPRDAGAGPPVGRLRTDRGADRLRTAARRSGGRARPPHGGPARGHEAARDGGAPV
jgi:cystathionine gamma-synthase